MCWCSVCSQGRQPLTKLLSLGGAVFLDAGWWEGRDTAWPVMSLSPTWWGWGRVGEVAGQKSELDQCILGKRVTPIRLNYTENSLEA